MEKSSKKETNYLPENAVHNSKIMANSSLGLTPSDKNLVLSVCTSDEAAAALDGHIDAICPLADRWVINANYPEAGDLYAYACNLVCRSQVFGEMLQGLEGMRVIDYLAEAEKKSFSKSRKRKRAQFIKGTNLTDDPFLSVDEFLKILESRVKYSEAGEFLLDAGIKYRHLVVFSEGRAFDDMLKKHKLSYLLESLVGSGMVEVHYLSEGNKDVTITNLFANNEITQNYADMGLIITESAELAVKPKSKKS